ncbi:MAG: hypothetical protein ACOC2U_03275 [bacterium]
MKTNPISNLKFGGNFMSNAELCKYFNEKERCTVYNDNPRCPFAHSSDDATKECSDYKKIEEVRNENGR